MRLPWLPAALQKGILGTSNRVSANEQQGIYNPYHPILCIR